MSSKINIQLSKETVGAWLQTEPKEDVHVYVNEHSVVIGNNEDYDNMKFTPLCLVIEKEGIRLQYKDDKGEIANVPLNTKYVYRKLIEMLENIKQEHV
jgi:hypothetical protein